MDNLRPRLQLACLVLLDLLPTTLALTNCDNGVCTNFPDGHDSVVRHGVALFGIVLGIFVFLSVTGVIFALVRRRRIRVFQRTYLRNAQANAAAGQTMVTPMSAHPAALPAAYHYDHHHHTTMNQTFPMANGIDIHNMGQKIM
ncbi:hypothetical protein FB451DRAFT_1555470 [Mycena latifolia]|nr:hypothetical protein FB451DRAFT_1555470 [Mycena latifolia]